MDTHFHLFKIEWFDWNFVFLKNFTTYVKKIVSMLKSSKNQREYLKTGTGFFLIIKSYFMVLF